MWKTLAFFAGSLAALVVQPLNAAETIDTVAFAVVDGDTITAGDVTIELTGIDAPELGWSCTLNGTSRDCGLIARSSLLDLTAGARLVCQPADGATYRCTANGYDVSEGMVYTGWAVPLQGAPASYARVLREARARPRGLWRGSFTGSWPALDEIPDTD